MPKTTTSSAPDPFASMMAQIGLIQGVGGDPASESKAKGKADKQLAELQGKIQKQLAEQQAKYALQLQAQQAAASLAQQVQQQGWQSQWNAAELTGEYNGQTTLAGKQQQQNKYEFDVTSRQQEEMNVLKREISNREMKLAELTQEQNNAIQRGELELSREIQTRKVALEEELGRGQQALEKMEISGYMENGQLTEAARASRRQEAMRQAEISGVYTDPETGEQMGLTDAAQQWRSQLGLDYARTAAQLAQSPADYFESAAFMRGAEGSGAVGFLNSINQNGLGSNQGFRSAQSGLPQVNSMQNLTSGLPPTPTTSPTPTTVPSGPIPAPAPPAPGQPPAPITPPGTPMPPYQAPQSGLSAGEQSRFMQLSARQNQLREAGEAGLSPQDTAELAQYQSRMTSLGIQPGEQARMAQILARQNQLREAGEGDVGASDLAELARYTSRASGAELDQRIQPFQQGYAEQQGFNLWLNQSGLGTALPDNEQAAHARMQQLQAQYNALPPEERAQYSSTVSKKMAALTGVEGPSSSVSSATLSAQGAPQNFTSTMHTEPLQPQLQAAQSAMPTVGASPDRTGPSAAPASSGTYGNQAQQRLNAFAPTFQAGAHKLAPGALESMSATERGLFSSAAKASGINPQDFEEQYKRSRLQTGVSATAI